MSARWQRVQRLYHAALERPASAREEFLREACGGDAALLREVQSLLDQPISAEQFLVAGESGLSDTPSVRIGQRLGVYEVQALLGQGGMGEVYRARDTRLGRDVAVKLLPHSFVSDPDRCARFEREARVLATLNHPHIGAIYGLEDIPATSTGQAGARALVLELVEGDTLADRLATGPLPIPEALSVARQIAEGLEAAHEKGIVHRDLKPSNIKITPDGTVKVLDFGLAKAFDSSSPAPGARATEAGVILGTAAYMSPEQARGKPVDKRTDIWAFGCVPYEMLTGRLPFIGETPSDTIVAILERTPDLSALPAATPAPIRRLLLRCLDKEAKRRLRDIGDARAEIDDALGGALASTTPMPIVERRARFPRLAWLVAGVFGVLVIALLVAAVAVWQREPVWTNPLEGAQFTRLTNFEGSEIDASVSADGKFVVFTSDRDGPIDVWVTQVGSGEFKNLTAGRFPGILLENTTRHVGFSQDASKVWWTIPDGQRGFDNWLVPAIGGVARRFVARGVEMAWSPDGNMLAYHEFTTGDPIFIADPDAGNPRRIFVDKPGYHCHYPTWSPDGRYIYFVRGQQAIRDMDIWRVAAAGGEPERITHHQNWVVSPTLLDNRTLLYSSLADDGSGPWLYGVDVEQRIPHRIGLGIEQYKSISATADGRRLVVSIDNPTGQLWSLPVLDHAAAETDAAQMSLPNVRASGPSTGPDYLVYLASQGGGLSLWKHANGAAVELWKGSEEGIVSPPAISADASRVSFTVRRRAQGRLYVMNADGTDIRTVGAPLNVGGVPSWSPDGTSVVVAANTAEGSRVFKVPMDGGTPTQLTDEVASSPLWSPDGRIVLYSGTNVAGRALVKAITSEGTPVPFPNLFVRIGDSYRFMPDSRTLVFMRGDSARAQDFYLLDLGTERERRLSNLKPGFAMQTFDVSRDGKRIIFDRVRDHSDIVLIDLKGK